MKRPVALVVAAEFGLSLGLAPGGWVDVATPGGVVSILSIADATDSVQSPSIPEKSRLVLL